MKLNQIGIARTLTGAVALLLAAMLVIGSLALNRSQSIARNAAAEVDAADALIRQSLKWQGMTEVAVTRSAAAAISSDPAVGALFKENMANDTPRIQKLRKDIGEAADTPEDQAQMKEIIARGAALLAASKKAKDAGAAGDQAAVKSIITGEYAPATRAYLEGIDGFVKLQEGKATKALADAAEARSTLVMLGSAGAALIVAFGIFVAWALVRSIVTPLAQAVQVAEAVAGGDLRSRIEVEGSNETSQLLAALKRMN
ncbi:MAG TPA: HAMP domain-containing protein, partial [Burkholderiaceae bacterium]